MTQRASGLPVGDLPERGPVPVGPVTIDLSTPSVALAVGAHPDDVEFGCGATLAKWAAEGCRIHHLVLTDGSKGTWSAGRDRGVLVAERRHEQQEAARILGGGPVEFLSWVDGELESGAEPRRQVCSAIRRVRPDVVLGHDPWRRYRLHPDHRHAGWLVTDGVVAARDATYFPEVGPPHRPTTVLLWEPDEPNHVESAGAFLERKIEALLAHRSQYVSTMGFRHDVVVESPGTPTAVAEPDEGAGRAAFAAKVRRQARSHGRIGRIGEGEAFHRIDDL